MAFLLLHEITAFLANKMQTILQKLIKYQPFIMDTLRKGVYICHIHTESGAEIGYKTGNKASQSFSSKLTFLFSFLSLFFTYFVFKHLCW